MIVLFKPLLISLPLVSELASSASAQNDEAPICAVGDGPL